MTNKEAIEILTNLMPMPIRGDGRSTTHLLQTSALMIAIMALKQQPCEDCISRTELLSRIDAERKHLLDLKMDGAEHIIVHHARRIIEDMPSVNAEAENFTDEEKRLFLASVAREMRVCEVIDSEKTKVKLVPILERVKDKVLRSSLWKEVEE